MEWLIGALGIAGTASGWFFAWRARGEANEAAERARLAEARTGAAEQRAFESSMAAAATSAQLKGAEIDVANAKQALARERADQSRILEHLAQAGAPVGDVLVDSTMDRLYADRERTRRGAGPGSGGDPIAVPAAPAGASGKASSGG